MAGSDSVYQRIGRKTALALRQGEWLLKSVFGSGPEAIKAEESAGKALASAILRDVQLSTDARAHLLVEETGARLADLSDEPEPPVSIFHDSDGCGQRVRLAGWVYLHHGADPRIVRP